MLGLRCRESLETIIKVNAASLVLSDVLNGTVYRNLHGKWQVESDNIFLG